MIKKPTLKLLFLITIVIVILFIAYFYKQHANKFAATEDHGYFGEETTGDIPRLVYVQDREGLDEKISSTNADRMFNQAYLDQYKDSLQLSKQAQLVDYKTSDNTAQAVLEFDNGSVVDINYTEDPRYVGNIEVSTKVITSARSGNDS